MTGIIAAHRSSQRHHRGFIMVAALWLLAALAALASIASLYIAQSAAAVMAVGGATQLEMFTTAGVELAAYELSSSSAAKRATHGNFSFRLANSSVAVEYMSEAARINLNMAPRSTIAGLFAALGAPPEQAGEFANRVIAWRSAPPANANLQDDGVYHAAGLTYLPRHGAFNNVDELLLVVGLPMSLVERALPFFTVYSGVAEVNVLDAAPEVVAALPGMSPLRLTSFLDQRESLSPDDPVAVLGALGGNQPGATVTGSSAYRVRMRITLPDGRQSRPEGVVALLGAGDSAAYRIFTWRDDIDPVVGSSRR